MDEQERKMLEEALELSRDNNVMLRKLVHAQRMASFWKLVYWTIIILAILVSYYWLESYISPLVTFFSGQDFAKVMNAVHSLPK